jgi:hypothetical protein
MTNIWTPNGNRVAALAPGPGDLFVVGMLFGKRVFVWPITDYDRAITTTQAFARQITQPRPFTIKVLPMSLDELLAHMGMTRAELAAGVSPAMEQEFRQLGIEACMKVLRECNEPQVRAEAVDLLTSMGALGQ